MTRHDFEDLVGAMAAAGLVLVEDATFEKADKTILYRKVTLTREGYKLNERTPVELLLTDRADEREPAKPKRQRSPKRKTPPANAGLKAGATIALPPSPQDPELEKQLRAWRLGEAKKLGRPAFFVFGDRTLRAIVQARPATLEELLAVEGIGPAKAETFGQSIVQICRSSPPIPGKSRHLKGEL